MSNTNPNSRFISENAIEEARKEREDAWKKAYETGAASSPIPEPDYDPRTLYERLQEQRSKKEEAYAESRRFANQIRKLDTEEIEFLDTVDVLERQKQTEQKQTEILALADFNNKVAERHKQPVNTLIKRQNPKSPMVSRNPTTSKLSGIVRRRRRNDDTYQNNQPITNSATSDKDISSAYAQSDSSNEDKKKRRKESENTDSSAETGETNLLNMLASYASDESE
ncbi:hypothetical protein COEREDRAFT_84783 [Coemansia reversa NRRL 1564]|uniref:FAM192A/Fyv6 N-terminal domain-containing protein n=1 Tax=Coemansia reversa (strain ATCC 12441 / NRRL 1564) TaxID=763665 RepID=A0A2G5BII1_COERN|nr:hypothetical protein COEREDRAFT_84783 [Coemansia reversa NRRL 1564]|eukprot:PIA18830.1 hypothetical protein COEREDRAFT_84783 [Coemansia reversa NRRL 1564]